MTNTTSITLNFLAFLKEIAPDLALTTLEVGARKLNTETEPFYELINALPNAKLVGFEADAFICKELNANSTDQFQYYGTALSDKQGTAPFYETINPMCSSLYEPNESFTKRYNGMDVAELQTVTELSTTTLDQFMNENLENSADFIKIDVQGAELDVFKGGIRALEDVLFIVAEVEFVELYHGQPLFGDVSSFLQQQGFMFHKFLSLDGRALKPVIIGGHPNTATQHMWADAVFIRNLDLFDGFTNEQLLITGALAFVYNSPDLTYLCLEKCEQLTPESKLTERFLKIITTS
jgi:FkbM family methyltransferase